MINPIEFIEGIFGKGFALREDQPLFCGFRDSPSSNRNWKAETADADSLPECIKRKNNCYFSSDVYTPTQRGDYRKKKEFLSAAYAVVLDDIGTKVNINDVKLPLSWRIETSPGNFQGGYILDEPCTDHNQISALYDLLAENKLTDPGAKGASRWVRLPYGVNTKPDYSADAKPPNVTLVEWHPERQYRLDEISKAYNLKFVRKPKDCPTSQGDPVLAALQAAGLWKRELESGKHDIDCPWEEQHEIGAYNGTVYYEPSSENNNQGGFKCQNGNCSRRNISDLKSILGLPSDKKEKPFDAALEVVQNIPAFCDENGDPFVFLNGSCLPLRAREVKAHIIRVVYKATERSLKQAQVSEVISVLEGRAISEAERITLHLRIARYKGFFMYDLGDGRVVKIGKERWKIVEAPPIFRRYPHQQIQVEPTPDGDPWLLFDYMNVPKEYQLETLVLLISYLVPDIAHPVFHPHGAHGSGKTTLCAMVKTLLDPSSLGVTIAPKNKQELIRQINRHLVSLFDNMSKLDTEMSDIICVACTGGSVAKRTLFTDDDDSIFNFKRCIGLNGINLLISKPDLLDRSMLLHLERIKEHDRKLETELFKQFAKAKPSILGGMFGALSKAKKLYPAVNLAKKPRLADFATWGYAIAEALGEGLGKKFIAAYRENIKRQNAEVLQNNSLCSAVTLLMKAQPRWVGTIKETYQKLYDLVSPCKTDGTFPADPRQLRKHLERIQTILAESERITYHISEKPKKDGFHIVFNRK